MVVGNPGGRRVALFREALSRSGNPDARVVPYLDLLAGRVSLDDVVPDGALVRVESPDRDFEVERALIAAGAGVDDDGHAPTRVGAEDASRLEPDRGRIYYPRQWYLGFRGLLRKLGRQLADCAPCTVLNTPTAIEVMFDKPRCHALFVGKGIACPRGLGIPAGYDDLRERMARSGVGRAFVKLAHGSSASGVVALETSGRRVQAFTTVETVSEPGGGLRLYNTRSIRRETSEPAVAALIDALCRERAHAEQWVPKASLPGGPFDLRVVVIAGRACHAVARVSRSPLTNLHLLNLRGDPESVRARMPADAWDAALRDAERAAGAVPGVLYAGVDVVIASGFRRHAVLEINAFGDLLPGITFEGMDTYTAELAALQGVAVA